MTTANRIGGSRNNNFAADHRTNKPAASNYRFSTTSGLLEQKLVVGHYQASHDRRLGDFIRQLKCSGYKKRKERRRLRRRERKRREELKFLQQQDESIPLSETCGLSLTELEAMAARQARQLETQEQLLAAKAQRLRYLKSDGETERLQRLRDKVVSQEERLRKLRALRGKVQTSRNGNSVLSTDLESLRAVFNEKEKELSLAVAKVDELTRQLEDIRRGNKDQYKQANNGQSTVAVELDKLRRELMYRQKLREAQATRVAAQRAALTQRQEESVRVDRRIAELQERLHRKRLLNHQLAATIKHQENVHEFNNGEVLPNKNDPKYQTLPYNTKLFTPFQLSSSPASSSNTSNNKHHHHQQPLQLYQQEHYDQQENFEKSLQQMQLISLEQQQQQSSNNYNNAAESNNKKMIQIQNQNNHNNNLQFHHQQLMLNQNQQVANNTSRSTSHLLALKQQQQQQQINYNGGLQASNSHGILKSRPLLSSNNSNNNTGGSGSLAFQQNSNNLVDTSTGRNYVATKEMMMTSSSNTSSSNGSADGFALTSNVIENNNSGTQSSSCSKPALPPKPAKPTPPPRQAAHDSTPFSITSQTQRGSSSSSSVSSDGLSNTIGLVQPDRTELPIKPKPLFPKKGLQSTGLTSSSSGSGHIVYDSETNNSTNESATVRLSINRRIEMPPAFLFPESDPPPLDLVPDNQSSSHTTNSTNKSASSNQDRPQQQQQLQHHDSGSSLDSVDAAPLNHKSHQFHYGPSSSSPVGSNSPLIEEYTLPDVFPLANNNINNGSMSTMGKTYNANNISIPSISQNTGKQLDQHYMMNLNNCHQYNNNNNNAFLDEHFISSNQNSNQNVISSSGLATTTTLKSTTANTRTVTSSSSETSDENSSPTIEQLEQHHNHNLSERDSHRQNKSTANQESNHQLESYEAANENGTCNSNSEQTSPERDETSSSDGTTGSNQSNHNVSSGPVRRIKKGNLKTTNKEHPVAGRRVSFDPLALLLDASLEGEFDLVVKTAGEVGNPSAANDEGITALHNGICAGHAEVVRFLVEFGCDVNAQDSDGWTPLHCAASCNNVGMVKFLILNGTCIFATTLSDHETAAEKCEEDEDGFGPCSEYLYSIQEKLGIINGGVVFALFDYDAQNPDELSFHDGDRLVILRKGDEFEREWWWASLGDKEQGYVPRNLLGLFPRVAPQKRSES